MKNKIYFIAKNLYVDESTLTVFGTHVEGRIGEIAGRVARGTQSKKF